MLKSTATAMLFIYLLKLAFCFLLLYLCCNFLFSKIQADGKSHGLFCGENQSDHNFQVSLQKYIIPAALYYLLAPAASLCLK